MTRYITGDPVVLTDTFTVGGTPTDPDTVSLEIVEPDGTSTVYTYAAAEITKSSTGVYTKTITTDAAGLWAYIWTGTGAAADVEDGTFRVWDLADDRTAYADVDQLELFMDVTFDETDLSRANLVLQAVSDEISAYCTKVDFTRTTSTVSLQGTYSNVLLVPGGPVTAVSSVTVDTTALVASDYEVHPHKLVRLHPGEGSFSDVYGSGLHWGGPKRRVTVAYTHGFSTVPPLVRQMTLRAAARAWINPEGRRDVQLESGHRVVFGQDAGVYLSAGDLMQLRNAGYRWDAENAR